MNKTLHTREGRFFRAPRLTRCGASLRRAAILLQVILLVALGGFILTTWLVFVSDNGRLAERDRQRLIAFHAAEAGVTQVVDWFNNPASFTPDPVLFTPFTLTDEATGEPYESYFDEDGNTRFEQFVDDPGTPEIEGYDVPGAELGVFNYGGGTSASAGGGSSALVRRSLFAGLGTRLLGAAGNVLNFGSGSEMSRIESIILTKVPVGSQPGLAQQPICRVVARGKSANDIARTVEMIIVTSPATDVRAPAAILSETNANFSGNADVWWGEVWARNTIILHSNLSSKVRTPAEDPWFASRSESHTFLGQTDRYANGQDQQGYTNTPISSSAAHYYQPYLNAVRQSYQRYTNIYQYQTLEFPTYDYVAIKELTLRRGYPYYRTRTGSDLIWPTDSNGDFYRDSNGNIITDASSPQGPKSYDAVFGSNPGNADYLDGLYSFVFVDTINGQPPASDGSNLATVRVSGNSTHSRGTIFMAANLTKTGQGNPPSLPVSLVQRPDGVNTQIPLNQTGVFHNGFLCVWGQFDGGGNPTVYGSVYAGRGYAAGGTPTVVWNHRLKDNVLGNASSRVVSRLWKTY